MDNKINSRLNSAELGNLWKVYMIEDLLIPFKIPLIEKCQDKEIKSVIKFALEMSKTYTQEIQKIYKKEEHPIPAGFSKEDMNVEAPALFTDTFALHYIHEMAKLGFRTIPQCIETTIHQDVLNCFYQAYIDYKELYQRSLDLLITKGVYPRPASIPIPEKVELIKKKHYLSGWLGKQRPFNAFEITNLHYTIHRNGISKALLLGFSQVTKDNDVREYMLRGIEMASNIISDFENMLLKENINTCPTLDSEVLPTKISPYSDKLMMVHVTQMGAGAIGIYGTDLASVFRKDLGLKYANIIREALTYSEDGTKILIEKGWLEKPPAAEEIKG